jgi:HSP20 family protein
MALIPYRGRTLPGVTLTSLRDEMNDLLNRFWASTAEPFGLAEWSPPLDMAETDDAVLVHVEVPGIEAKNLDISVTGNVLTIRGEKHDAKEEAGCNYLRVERRYGAFTRTLTLPAPVDAAHVEAKAHAGVLEIRLPKKVEAKPRKVEIKGA